MRRIRRHTTSTVRPPPPGIRNPATPSLRLAWTSIYSGRSSPSDGEDGVRSGRGDRGGTGRKPSFRVNGAGLMARLLGRDSQHSIASKLFDSIPSGGMARLLGRDSQHSIASKLFDSIPSGGMLPCYTTLPHNSYIRTVM
ncbi:hypothetical protein BHE74_00050935 [Ensete ventricosum]|nr:hypothetical protein BHE74_00050935 [Ensete ventricosum]